MTETEIWVELGAVSSEGELDLLSTQENSITVY